MVIIDTFAVIDNSLYTVQFEGESEDELLRIFNLWDDPQFLHDFFTENQADLNSGFFGQVSILEAVRETRREAKQLQKLLYKLAKEGESGAGGNLSQLFKPLSLSETGTKFERDKAYGINRNSWLRIYAIRVNVNVFVICGGAIKLTKTMSEREHLIKEITKLNITRNYLESDPDYSDFFYELSI